MRAFRLLVDFEAVLFIERLPQGVRNAIRSRLGQIRESPTSRSDYFEHDLIGRRVEINICDGFAIKYWIDQADRQIKVLDIHPADMNR